MWIDITDLIDEDRVLKSMMESPSFPSVLDPRLNSVSPKETSLEGLGFRSFNSKISLAAVRNFRKLKHIASQGIGTIVFLLFTSLC